MSKDNRREIVAADKEPRKHWIARWVEEMILSKTLSPSEWSSLQRQNKALGRVIQHAYRGAHLYEGVFAHFLLLAKVKGQISEEEWQAVCQMSVYNTPKMRELSTTIAERVLGISDWRPDPGHSIADENHHALHIYKWLERKVDMLLCPSRAKEELPCPYPYDEKATADALGIAYRSHTASQPAPVASAPNSFGDMVRKALDDFSEWEENMRTGLKKVKPVDLGPLPDDALLANLVEYALNHDQALLP